MAEIDPRIAFFDALAEGWDDEEPSSQAMAAELERHEDLLELKPGSSLLEVGCGTGKTTGWLAEQVFPGRVTAVDFSQEMVDRAWAKGIDADFRCVDVCSGDLGSGLYDVILCFHSFPHFRDQTVALKNFAAAMKPRGRLIVMHLAGSRRINEFHSGVDGPVKGDMLPESDQWQPLLAAAGLKRTVLIDCEDIFFLEAVHM